MSAGLSPLPNSLATINPSLSRNGASEQATVYTVLAIVAALNAIGVLIVWRRFAGALIENLPRDAMLLSALVVTAALAYSRQAWRRRFPLELNKSRGQRFVDRLVGYGSSLALVLLAVGCCFPANHTSDWLIWLPLLVADQFWRQSFFDSGDPAISLRLLETENETDDAVTTIAFRGNDLTAVGSGSKASNEIALEEEIVQQLFRVRDQQGREVVYGTVRADFQSGQRTAVVHVGFCPPLLHRPEIEAESIPGSAAQIKVVQALAHGTRLDVRLPAAAEDNCHLWIDLAATPAAADEHIHA